MSEYNFYLHILSSLNNFKKEILHTDTYTQARTKCFYISTIFINVSLISFLREKLFQKRFTNIFFIYCSFTHLIFISTDTITAKFSSLISQK